MTIVAVYLDLTDVGCARVWRWLTAVGLSRRVEVRPFCPDVPDPWACATPPFALELLMLVEQARAHGPGAVADVVDAAVGLLDVDAGTAAGQLAVWLEVRRVAGLGLDEYDRSMDRLRAEVGLWQAEATTELGVTDVPTVVLGDGSAVLVRLDRDVVGTDAATDLHRRLERLAGR